MDRHRRARLGLALLMTTAVTSALPMATVSGDPVEPPPPGQGPTVSPEHRVSDPMTVPRAGDQSQSAVASHGNGYFVVWRDAYRRGIFGSRVSAAGEILDPAGIGISSGEDANPAIAWDGTNYFVAWSRSDHTRAPIGVFGTRVTPEGRVLDAGGFAIATGGRQGSPAVAFNGTHHLVVWSDWRDGSGSDVYAARVDPAGRVLDPDSIQISAAPRDQADPAVASDGGDFLIGWSDSRNDTPPRDGEPWAPSHDIFAARVSAGGQVLDGDGFLVSAAPGWQGQPAIAWDGSRYLAVWADSRNADNRDVFGARVTPAGVVEGPELAIASSPDHDSSPNVAPGGTGAFVVWHQDPTERPEPGTPPPWPVHGVRVTDGTVAPPLRIGTGRGAAVAFNGTEYLVSWAVGTIVLPGPYPPDDDVYAARVSGNGAVIDDPALLVTPQADWQRTPAVAWNGRTYLLTWRAPGSQRRSQPFGPPAQFFARLSPTGQALDGTGVAVPGVWVDPVQAASNGDNFLLAWITVDGIAGVRIGADGAVLDRAPFTIPTGPSGVAPHHLALASDGADYFAVWQQNNPDRDYRTEVVGARIPAAGMPTSPPVPVSPGEGSRPAAAWNGESFLVAWVQPGVDSKGPPPRRHGVAAIRVSAAGTVLDRRPIVVAADPDREVRTPMVAAGDGNFMVAWQSTPKDYTGPMRMEGVRISASGRLLDRSPLVLATGPLDFGRRPMLSWNGLNFLLVWGTDWPGGDVSATRVSQAGTVLDPAGFVVAGSPDGEGEATVTAGPHGRSAVVYVRTAPEAPYYDAPRAFMRFVDE